MITIVKMPNNRKLIKFSFYSRYLMAMALHLLLHYLFATVLGIAKLHIKSHNASNITAGALIAPFAHPAQMLSK